MLAILTPTRILPRIHGRRTRRTVTVGGVIVVGLATTDRRESQKGKDGQGAHHDPTANTRQAATTTTATSEVGRKIFQPRRISWS